MKLHDNITPTKGEASKACKVKGHVTIVLRDKDGREEVVADDHNMQTDAISEFLTNCGFLNYPNVDQNNLVTELLGGIMGFDDEIDEDATILHVPAGLKMTFNSCVDAVNTTDTELISYKPNQSGEQPDKSFLMTFEASTSQAIGTIASVCLTGKNYGLAGEGNARSLARHASTANIANLGGTVTAYSGVPGYVFNIDMENSTCMSLSFEDVEGTTTAFLRKYLLPISKINLKGTRTAPILLEEDTITIPSNMEPYLTQVIDPDYSYWIPLFSQDDGENLLLWNRNLTWGQGWGTSFTQYLWTITPAGVVTEATISNTSGEDLQGLGPAFFDGNYAFFINATETEYAYNATLTSTYVYILNRTSGVITKIENPYGGTWRAPTRYSGNMHANYKKYTTSVGFAPLHGSGDGRMVTTGSYPVVVDAVLEAVYPTNAASNSLGNLEPVSGLIRHSGITLYREQGYIATIFNLSAPVVKPADKAMIVTYRLTFEEEEE